MGYVLFRAPTVRCGLPMLVLACVLLTTCTAPPHPIPPTPPQWVDPTDANPILANRWRVHEARQHQRPIRFVSLAPVYISFDETHLSVHPSHCNFMRAALLPDGLRHYQWQSELSTAMICSDQETNELTALIETFAATNSYTLTQDRLTLTGPTAHILLIVDNTPPTPTSIPTATPGGGTYPRP